MKMRIFLFCALCLVSCSKEIAEEELPLSNPDPEVEEPVGLLKVNMSGEVIIGSPGSNSVLLSIAAANGTAVAVNYGTSPEKMTQRVTRSVLQNNIVEIKLENLSAGTRYYYSFALDDKAESDTYTFVTQRQKGSSFSFGVQGDSHPERNREMFDASLYQLNMQNVAKYTPDLYFTLGDDFSIERFIESNTVTQKNVNDIYSAQRKYLGMTGCNAALFLVNGNHEQAAKYLLDGTAVNPAVCAGIARKLFYPLPDPSGMYTGDLEQVENIGYLKDYFAFEWGDALFVTLDPYWHSDAAVDNIAGSMDKETDPWAATIGTEQYQWLKNTLANSTSKYKFVFTHHVRGTGRGGIEEATLYEWGGYDMKGRWLFPEKRPDWELPIHQLFVKYGVTIFFQGHDHLFCKQELDGVIYQSCPNPADNTYRAFNADAYKSGDILPNAGHLNVEVRADEVIVKYIRAFLPGGGENGSTAYTYTVKAK